MLTIRQLSDVATSGKRRIIATWAVGTVICTWSAANYLAGPLVFGACIVVAAAVEFISVGISTAIGMSLISLNEAEEKREGQRNHVERMRAYREYAAQPIDWTKADPKFREMFVDLFRMEGDG